MASGNAKSGKGSGAGRFALAALFNVLGTLMLLAVIALAAPLTVPQLMGYGVYNVVSGSMEPEFPVGTAVYSRAVEPASVQEGDVIVFQDGNGGMITHRVVTNRTSLGEFVTKGDANDIEDLEPAPYEAFVGRVEAHVPVLGGFMAIYSTAMGKVYLLLAAACGVMFNMVASRMRRRAKEARMRQMRTSLLGQGAAALAADRFGADAEGLSADALAVLQARSGAAYGMDGNAMARQGEGAWANAQGPAGGLAAGNGATGSTVPAPATAGFTAGPASGVDGSYAAGFAAPPQEKRRPLVVARNIGIALLLLVFLGSGGYIAYTNWQYGLSDALYSDAASRYVTHAQGDAAGEKPPIEVDFQALQAENPDVVGWIYCEGTAIDYPVLQGRDNDEYLHTDYTGAYNIDGSIFVDGDNRPGFVDSNTIVYGHHMNSGSMFAGLVDWADQAFYEEHPVIWLLTPQQNYKLVVFSAHHSDARSYLYDIIATPNDKLDQLLSDAVSLSDIQVTDASFAQLSASSFALSGSSPSSLKMNPLGRYVMLTTCAYLFDNDRYVLHAALVPVA